jgi:hypothetical protein
VAQFFSIAPNASQLQAVEAALGVVSRDVDKVLVAAVKDTARQLRTRISAKIRDRVVIKKKDIDRYLSIYHYKGVPQAKVSISESARVSLKYFAARQSKAGVTYKINKTDSRKTVPGAFLVSKLGGHAFRRIGLRRRQPGGRYAGQMRQKIAKLFGPSPWGVFVEAGLEPQTATEADSLLQTNIDRRTNLLLLRLAGKVATPNYERN